MKAMRDARPPLEQGTVEVELPSGDWVRVQVELAMTPEDQRLGLMFREELDEYRGMLFLFRREALRSFWMKNTLISLDMIFIDRRGRIVGIVHEAEPLTTTPRAVDKESQYVLEVRGGWARTHGVESGNRVRFAGTSNVPLSFGLSAD